MMGEYMENKFKYKFSFTEQNRNESQKLHCIRVQLNPVGREKTKQYCI